MNFKKIEILQFVIFILVLCGMLYNLFKKNYKHEARDDIYSQAFSSVIQEVYYFKDDYGSGIATKIKSYEVPFCFTGMNYELNVLYFGFAEKGDSIYKKSNSDTILIKRENKIYTFKVSSCVNRK